MRKTIYIVFILIICASCGGTRKTPAADSRYQRKPIAETTEEQLKAEGELIEATAQQMIGNTTEALSRYRKVMAEHPENAAACYETGRIMLAQGWTDSALHYAQQACARDKRNVWYQLLLAQIYERRQEGKELVATWEQIVKQNPDVVEYYYDLSNAYLKNNDVPGSIEALNRVERRYGISEEVSLQKQKLWSAIDKPEKARKELEALAAAMPSEPKYSAIVAESYRQEKNYAQALRYYNIILQANPDDENAHISLAECYLAMGDYPEVYRHLRLGLANPALDCKTKLLYLGEVLRNEGYFMKYAGITFRLADTVSRGCPADDGHAYHYGLLLAAQERYAEAADQLLLHLSADSSQYDAWSALLTCENLVAGREQELLNHARRAAVLFPLHALPYSVMAECLLRQGDCKEALAAIERAAMVAPGDAQLRQRKNEIAQQCR